MAPSHGRWQSFSASEFNGSLDLQQHEMFGRMLQSYARIQAPCSEQNPEVIEKLIDVIYQTVRLNFVNMM